MMLDMGEIARKYKIDVTGVFHAGAHLAEEASLYKDLGINRVWWVEANPKVAPKIRKVLRGYPEHVLIEALLYSEDDVELDFNVTNYDGMSSSILQFGTHSKFSPDIKFVNNVKLKTQTVDTLVDKYNITNCNFLCMDLQGAELECLKGATEFIKGVDYVFSEINKHEVYVGCAKIQQLDKFLSDFKRVETLWVPGQGWGDGFWIRK